jgi:cation-transporting ATPase E
MTLLLHLSNHQFKTIIKIISRNVFILVNWIILAVVVLLVIFGDYQDGIFLGFITLLNIAIGCFQEVNAWLNLEKLQLLTTPKIIRINEDNTESIISPEEIKVKDKIKIKTGDQVPCDGILIMSHGFGVSESLITGESNSFLRKPKDSVFAGSIVTSGSGILEVEKTFSESRISTMTKDIKKYSLIQSPIQYSVSLIIKYLGYLLLVIIIFVVVRGYFINEATLNIIQNIGALTSALLPQGMVVIVTLFYSYGAVHLYRRHVLLQEINATEKIGRIKNLCMDKTGTLTDNSFVVENTYNMPGVDVKYIEESISAYISIGDSSQTVDAIKSIFKTKFSGSIIDDITFSSSLQFGAAHIKDDFGERIIVAGAPDILLSYLTKSEDKEWLQKFIDIETRVGNRLIFFAESDSNILPKSLLGIKLKALSVFIFNNNLREGVKDSIQFFQDRGVTIRIISGDNPDTVVSVATRAGVNNSNAVVTGAILETWTDADFLENIHKYTIFARIKPEQKEKIIEYLKKDGFTAMIGDGANDALAIKKADLGIALFDGAQATRQVASIVLVKNSFADLPNGVRLADSIIQNLEICASIIFNQVFVSLFFFIIVSAASHLFPFTPLNITFINYFTIALPSLLIYYWIIRPTGNIAIKHNKSFLRRIIPFSIISAIPQALVAVLAFYESLEHFKRNGLTSLVVVAFIIVGVIFFMYTPKLYSGPITKNQKKQFFFLVVIEFIFIVIFFKSPFLLNFYNLNTTLLSSVARLLPVFVAYIIIQYVITKIFLIEKVLKPIQNPN